MHVIQFTHSMSKAWNVSLKVSVMASAIVCYKACCSGVPPTPFATMTASRWSIAQLSVHQIHIWELRNVVDGGFLLLSG